MTIPRCAHFPLSPLVSAVATACVAIFSGLLVSALVPISAHAARAAPARVAPKPAAKPPAAATPAPLEDPIPAAADAYRVKSVPRLAAAVAAARGHVLEIYPEYWQLVLSLDEATPEMIRSFLAKYPQSYLGDRLRADWIRQLGRRGEWQPLREEYPALVNEDSDTTCWALQARWRMGDAEALTEARGFWRNARAIPEPCVPMLDELTARGEITVAHTWERVRALLDAGQIAIATRTIERLPVPDTLDPKLIAQINSSAPAAVRVLERNNFDLRTRAARETLLFAIGRVARNEVGDAAAQVENFKARMVPEDRAQALSLLGLQGARQHHPEALNWYRAVPAVGLSEEHLAWRTRAALRAGNWAEVKLAIDAMSANQRAEATWTYWLGRALRELGQPALAQAEFGKIAGQHHFYGQLALEELGQKFVLPVKAAPVNPEEIAAVERDPGIRRALALFKLAMRTEAVREWSWSTRSWDDRALLAAADLARRTELWDRAINTAERTVVVHDFSLRYLAPYRDLFASHAKAQSIEDAWVMGLVRQESRFITNARSWVGASGLMQLMPATARQVARRIGMKEFRWSNVIDPDVNIELGTSYMREVLDSLGHPILASAGYNAGPGRAQRWRADGPLEGAIYAETIPFNETRDYVKRVMSNTMYYAALLSPDAEPRVPLPSLKTRMGIITGRGVAAEPVRAAPTEATRAAPPARAAPTVEPAATPAGPATLR